MGIKSAVIHCHANLEHQVELAAALRAGFKLHGIDAVITGQNGDADIHVCMGPWFALERWRHHNTLYIDRAYWRDPECVSVHWLKNGEKRRDPYREVRPHPDLKPMKRGDRKIYLCDYGDKWGSIVADDMTARYHPAQSTPEESLEDALNRHEIAIGRRTTALVDAAIGGLRVRTDDPYSPIYSLAHGASRDEWIRQLAWHNWSLREIDSGDMWNGLGKDF